MAKEIPSADWLQILSANRRPAAGVIESVNKRRNPICRFTRMAQQAGHETDPDQS